MFQTHRLLHSLTLAATAAIAGCGGAGSSDASLPVQAPAQVPVPTAKAGSAAECLDLNMFKPGARSAPVYSSYLLDPSGAKIGLGPTESRERAVNAPVTFNGVGNVLPVVSGSAGFRTDYVTVDQFDLVWHGRREKGELPEPFGGTSQFDWTGIYDPPARNRMFALTQTGEMSAFTRTFKDLPSATDTVIDRQTYLGQERVSVAAGSYDACKFAIDTTVRQANSSERALPRRFEWYAKGSGVLVLAETLHLNGHKDVEELQRR